MTKPNQEKPLAELDGDELCSLGKQALDAKNYAAAYRYLRAALERERSSDHLSLYALALARHTGNTRAGIELCAEAVKKDPKNPEHFLRLGIIYLIAGRRKEAIRIFHLGLRSGRHPVITRYLKALGLREKPMLPFLSRSNPVNKCLGMIRTSLSKRK